MGPNYINPFDLIYLIGIIASICIIQSLKTKRIVAAFVAGVICWLILLGGLWFDDVQWTRWIQKIPNPTNAQHTAFDSDSTGLKSFVLLFGLPASVFIIFFGLQIFAITKRIAKTF